MKITRTTAIIVSLIVACFTIDTIGPNSLKNDKDIKDVNNDNKGIYKENYEGNNTKKSSKNLKQKYNFYDKCLELKNSNHEAKDLNCENLKESKSIKMKEYVSNYFEKMNKYYKSFMNYSNNINSDKNVSTMSTDFKFKEKINNSNENSDQSQYLGINTKNGINNYEKLLDPSYRKEISDNFKNTISSQKFLGEIKTQMSNFKKNEVRNYIKDLDEFNSKEQILSFDNPLVIDEAKKLQNAIYDFAKKNVGSYDQIISGGILHDVSKYVKNESNIAREAFKNSEFSEEINGLNIEDLKKMGVLSK